MLSACSEYDYNMIVAGGDVAFLANGSTQAPADARAFFNGDGSTSSRKSPSKSPY